MSRRQEWARDDEPVGIRVSRASDLEQFYKDWGIPGVSVSYSDDAAGYR